MAKKKTEILKEDEIFKSDSTQELLENRAPKHGPYEAGAIFAQKLKKLYREAPMWDSLWDVEKETLDLTTLKIARILHGSFNRDDYDDTQAYFKLVSELFEIDGTRKDGKTKEDLK